MYCTPTLENHDMVACRVNKENKGKQINELEQKWKSCNFRGRDYRTFAENFFDKSQDTRKPRIISRSGFIINYLTDI